SNLAIIGRYLLTPEIFNLLETQGEGAGNEIQLTDAIDRLNKTQRVFAYEFTGRRYDVGNKLGYMQTSIEYGLEQDDIKEGLKEYLLSIENEL
ncbi:MAG: UTP--glucose-1-phosphate uridylyltransferase, partial [Aerococcus viridans]